MLENLPPEIKQAILGMAALLPTALVGRALAFHQLVKAGHRRFWSAELAWELPTAAFCAIVGAGLAAYIDAPYTIQNAIVGVVSYLGPRGMEVMLARWASGRKS